MQLHIQLRHRLLQMLDMACLIEQQHVAVAPDGTQRTEFLGGAAKTTEVKANRYSNESSRGTA
jgi:hypothetical protein